MTRHRLLPRAEWQREVEKFGLIYHTFEGQPYWDESAYYRFSAREVDVLEKATEELHQMCLKAVDFVVSQDRFADFRIPANVAEAIRRSWREKEPHLYGRFDLGYDGRGAPKLLEYNADTPTSLLEAAVIQWQWLQSIFPKADQFNSIWEGLIETWTALRAKAQLKGSAVYFASQDHWEDLMTAAVLRDTAESAGLAAESLLMEEIGWNEETRQFLDLKDRPIYSIFKLYPWEFLVRDDFGAACLDPTVRTQWIEPIWKMLLSNKAILAVLWEMYPGHDLLLPAYLDGPRDLQAYVVKPILGREGSNVAIVDGPSRTETQGPYGAEHRVWQGLYRLPAFDGNHPVIGSWVIGDEPRGIGIRETEGLITDDLARFIPHLISG